LAIKTLIQRNKENEEQGISTQAKSSDPTTADVRFHLPFMILKTMDVEGNLIDLMYDDPKSKS